MPLRPKKRIGFDRQFAVFKFGILGLKLFVFDRGYRHEWSRRRLIGVVALRLPRLSRLDIRAPLIPDALRQCIRCWQSSGNDERRSGDQYPTEAGYRSGFGRHAFVSIRFDHLSVFLTGLDVFAGAADAFVANGDGVAGFASDFGAAVAGVLAAPPDLRSAPASGSSARFSTANRL